jgi:hypothetical protein
VCSHYLTLYTGNLATWEAPLARFAQDARVATGVGIVSSFFGFGRVELTYSRIHRKAQQDQITRGQFGIGMVFN